jgi:carnitine-CoA ligase
VTTLGRALDEAVARTPAAPYLISGDDTLSFSDVQRRANGAAAALDAEGIGAKTRVAALVGNHASFVCGWFGVAHLGAALLPMDPRATASEAAGLLTRCRPELLLFDRGAESLAEEVTRATGIDRVPVEDLVSDPRSDAPPTVVGPDDVAVLLPTSGTTAASKLVMQTHRSMVLAGEGFPWWLGLTDEDRLMTALPLFHLNALAYSTLGALTVGTSLVILPRFSASGFLDDARAYGATEFNAVGAMLEMLMRQRPRADDDSNPLRLCYSAPAPPTEERHLAIEERFGFQVTAGYGLSETPYGTVWPRGERPFGSLGRLKQHPTLGEINEARVVSDGGGHVGPGEVGELVLRNPAVMAGYFGMEDETAHAVRDGWLHTGDLVRRDPTGTFFFVARKKDVIRRRGENIAPLEIEQALSAHPSVLEAAVVGVPSDLGEEDVKAFLVVGNDFDVGSVTDATRARLAAHKMPRYLELLAELPRTPTGRVAKHLLARVRTSHEIDLG